MVGGIRGRDGCKERKRQKMQRTPVKVKKGRTNAGTLKVGKRGEAGFVFRTGVLLITMSAKLASRGPKMTFFRSKIAVLCEALGDLLVGVRLKKCS